MKRLIVFAIVFLMVAGVAFAKGFEVKKKAGDFNVEMTIDKNPPVVGANNITVKIKDSADKYVTDAKVKIDYSMPAMPGMSAMDYKTDTTLRGEEYKAVMNLPMSGTWNINVKIIKGGKTSSVKFNIDAH